MKPRKFQLTAFNHVGNFLNWKLFQVIFYLLISSTIVTRQYRMKEWYVLKEALRVIKIKQLDFL